MELDDLKRRWQEQEQKLDASLRLNRRLLQATILGKAETALGRLRRLLWVGLVVNVAAAGLVGSFLGDHIAEPRYALPAAALLLGVIAALITGIRQIVAIHGIDYSSAIVAIQARLEELRAERIRTVKWGMLLSVLAWTPLFIVLMKAQFDVDVYATFGVPWVVANVVLGVAVIPFGLWLCAWLGRRLEGTGFLQRLMRDIGGQNLARAREAVTEWQRVEQAGEIGD